MKLIRLDKFLADSGIGTRSQVKVYFKKGMVSVNGQIEKSADRKINPESDKISFQNQPLTFQNFVYFMLNKPKGCVTANKDNRDRTVMDYIKEERHRSLSPVGRLDKDTEGLLLITDDGDLNHQLLSPKKHVDKTYLVTVRKPLQKANVSAFTEGLDIGEKHLTLPAVLEILDETHGKVTIREGKFHQIKRMFQAVDNEVVELKRLSMGSLVLDKSLAPGEYRVLTQEEIEELKKC